MTNGSEAYLPQFDPNDTIKTLFDKLGISSQAVLLIAIDEDGQAFPAAALGREMARIPDRAASDPVTKIINLEHASWVTYERNPRRTRTKIGGTTWDG